MSIAKLCFKVGMSRQNYYKERKHREAEKVNEAFIVGCVRRERQEQPRLGTRKVLERIRPELVSAGTLVGRDRLFDMLRSRNLLVPPLKRRARTTNSRHSLPVFVNLVKDIQPEAPNEVWVADITYLRIRGGFVYLALIMDLYSRRIVGYDCGDSLEATGAIRALKAALQLLPQGSYPIHHSDRGCQYCSHAYVQQLRSKGIRVSMTEEMHCYENAHAERLNGILKQELGLGHEFLNKEHAYLCVRQAVKTYNTKRPHLALKLKTPEQVYTDVA